MKKRKDKINERFHALSLTKKIILLIALIVFFAASIVLNNLLAKERRKNLETYEQKIEAEQRKKEEARKKKEQETLPYVSGAYSPGCIAIPIEDVKKEQEEAKKAYENQYQ